MSTLRLWPRLVCWTALAVLVSSLASAAARADGPNTQRFFGDAARDIQRSLESGDGWCIVSARQRIRLLPDEAPIDCVKFRVVVDYRAGRLNNDSVIEVTLGRETPWITVESRVPTAAGPAFAAAAAASRAVDPIDVLVPQLQDAINMEDDDNLRARGQRILGLWQSQRVALTDLIQKDANSSPDLAGRRRGN